MDIARQAAPEIDRLVLHVNQGVGPKHGTRLDEVARQHGLDSLEMLPHVGDFLQAGRLTRDLAILRMRYRTPELVEGRLDELEEKQLIRQDDSRLEATPALVPVLDAVQSARADVAAEAWTDQPAEVETATKMAEQIAAGASEEHQVAVVHRTLPAPADPYLHLHQRLTTLRYIRQHDHAVAWAARNLTAADMLVLTPLWHNDPAPQQSDLAGLTELGLIEGDPPRLTAKGREVRDAIESETNDGAQQTFDVLDDATATEFLTVLRRLPGQAA